MTLSSGTILSTRYEVRDFVGSDGTLDVYKALDLRLGRYVAVTVLEIRNCHEPEKLLTFEREAQIRAGLHHPRIMTIHDFGHDASCAFQVAEWLEGQSLRKRLKSGPLDWDEAMAIGQAVLEGLAVIHARGFTLNRLDETSVFLHRDVGAKLFAYELSRIGGPEGLGLEAAERHGIQSLARLLLQSLEEPDSAERSRDLDRLRSLAEGLDPDAAVARGRFESLSRDAPRPRRRRHRTRWVAAVLLLGLSGVALLYARRLQPPRPAVVETVPAPDPAPPSSQDSDARRLYLYGMQLLDNRDPESLARAQTYLQGAITRDAAFAQAHSGLADCLSLLGLVDALPREEALRLSLASSDRALQIDPALGEAHASRAFVSHWYRLDWKDAEKEYLRALELAPRMAGVHHAYGVFLGMTGRSEEGLDHLRTALELRPISRTFRADYALHLHWAGRSPEALGEFAKALELDPSRADTLLAYREVLDQIGRIDESVQVSQKLADLGAIPERDASALRVAYDAHGLGGYLKERIRQQEQAPVAEPVRLAALVALQGDRDRALRLLTRALREGSVLAARIPRDPAFASIRLDPRFRQLLSRMAYPES